MAIVSNYFLRSANVSSCIDSYSSTFLIYSRVVLLTFVLWSLYACSVFIVSYAWSHLCYVSYIYFSIYSCCDLVLPMSSLYYCVVSILYSEVAFSSWWRCSLLVIMNSPIYLSCSLILFYRAPTSRRWADAAFLSTIISALFSEMPLCISEHIRPYCCIVNVLRSIPFASITYWLCSNVQLFVTFSSNVLIVLLASIS
jgi:hypothetical protein